MKKFWNFVKNEDTSETELYFEGPISDETWLGDEITPALFRDEEAHGERIRQFIKTLKDQDGIITEFDDVLWGSMVELVTISREKRSVTFKDGTEIQL